MYATRDGTPWEPAYLIAIDGDKCIGCGRCYKVCSRDVMHLMGVDEGGQLVACAAEDDDDEEFVRKVMVLDTPATALAAARVTASARRNCQTHEAAGVLAAAA